MALIRWEPAREMQTIQQEMNRLFGSFFDAPEGAGGSGGGDGGSLRRWIPAMDLVEEGDHFVLRADLPGVREEDVNVELEDNVLTISGERKAEHEDRKEGYHRIERAVGRFSRSLTLPEGIDPDSIEARFENGVLTVRIPKPEERRPRRVEISVGDRSPVIEGSGSERGGGEQRLEDRRAGSEGRSGGQQTPGEQQTAGGQGSGTGSSGGERRAGREGSQTSVGGRS
ncbi:MAG: Hsp20/alpha crystallin family protein [Solirubrobacterales bacterium]|nr:Hsp20/alpha crystallin family protein [Solirubrobacterales bacterium]